MKYQLVLVALILGITGCQQGQAANNERQAPEPLVEAIDPQQNPIAAVKAKEKQMTLPADQNVDALRRQALSAIGDASADSSSQCRVTGFGHKPCGGPERYIAYSTKGGNEADILAKIAAYNAAAEAENVRLGRMSDCAVVPKPVVELSGGQCKLVKNNSY
ncbi:MULTISPECIES: hypothetical protein [unclassified Arsukibacterium]|uniref:hypothetical protein n=1 Tax=unclassified Arsukibacterium TaxID=2635278 RepID=UPI000C4D03A2|nr:MULTISPECIES: hypothetical protein [unclassified Arsukibacterium]MAA96386.1 hypothetical protein [Rheinheimera sp.]MBM33103.1 hypothetical protein [Rheinheimera sp.]HAW92046.1 hypothetical protein [Candidatus Azambacteria bacterium]|tara:strand:- start:12159 stop:12641 length:483 start_codon:yes stop_codon:yes gene_type:complete